MAGTRTYKCDFHIHTPCSLDYKDANASYESIVNKAIESGLDAIAITDHNTVDAIKGVQEAALETNLVVFPGVEITAQGGHILALFEPGTTHEFLDEFLTLCGIGKKDRGQEKALGHDILKILEIGANRDGILIAAHVDSPKGFLHSIQEGPLKSRIYMDERLSAMEVVSLETAEKYNRGLPPDFSRNMACIQGSDAHSVDDVGRRPTLLRMHHLTVSGLRQAFSEPILRISCPSTSIPVFPHIKSLNVSQGFLSGQTFEFNENLNCLLGGTGSGKSTIIEFLRFAFDQMSDDEELQGDCFGKLRDLAGEGTIIEVEFQNSSGETMLLRRVFNEYDNPIAIENKEGEIIEGLDIRQYFPVFAYSQGEALSIAKNPLAQLELIDRHLDIREYEQKINTAYRELDQQVTGLVVLEDKIRDKEPAERDISTLEAQVKDLNSQLDKIRGEASNPIVSSHQFWNIEKNYLSELVNSLLATKSELTSQIGNLDIAMEGITIPEENTPNKELLEEVDGFVLGISNLRVQLEQMVTEKLDSVEREVRSRAEKWKALWEIHDKEYREYQKNEYEKQIGEITERLDHVQRRLTEKKGVLKNVYAAQKQYDKLIGERNANLHLIDDQKQRITILREKKVRELSKVVGREIKLVLQPGGNIESFRVLLAEILRGTNTRQLIISQVCETIAPDVLFDLVRRGDIPRIDSLSRIGQEWSEKIAEYLRGMPDSLYRIQTAKTEDFLEISLRVGSSDSPEDFRPLDKLSTGQKATVIVMLSMVEGSIPIIFDQPEDALYSPFIFNNIVRVLRKSKGTRQFIFATHNSNIAVASDLDHGIVLESTSSDSSVHASGGLDDPETREMLILHLEGGDEAVRTRVKKLNIII